MSPIEPGIKDRRDYLVLSACAVLFLILIFPLRGSITDDTYIHMQYARNLAESGELSFNRGDPSYGATSPLWVALLALVYKLGLDLAAWSRILSQFFGFMSALTVYYLVKRIDGRRSTAAAACLMMTSEAWLVRWSCVGMETSFAVFMTAAVLYASVRALESKSRSILFGIVLFLAYLARPESLLLVPLALLTFVITGREKKFFSRFVWLLAFAPLFIIWLLVIKEHTGTFFPLTAGAKQGNLLFSISMLSRIMIPAKILAATVSIPIAVALVALISSFTGSRDRIGKYLSNSRPELLLSALWLVSLPVVYTMLDFQVLSRYMVPVSPAAIALGAAGMSYLGGRYLSGLRAGRIVMTVFCAVTVVQNILFYSIVVVRPTREFSQGLEQVISGMARYLAANSDPGARVASPDIGAIGYFSGRKVLDLGGLISPEINRMRAATDVETIIEEGLFIPLGADYLLDRSTVPSRFDGKVINGHLFSSEIEGVVPNLGIRKQEPVTYVLYRITPVPAGREGF